MRFSDSHHFRKMIAGCCMVAGPLVLLVAFIFSPPLHTDASDQMKAFAAHQDKLLFSSLMFLVATVLVLAATLGLMHMLRERMVGYGHAGGALAIVGLIGLAAQGGATLVGWQMVRDGVQATDVAAWDGLMNDAATVIPLFIPGFLALVGFVVLAAGLYRAKAVDWWMAATIALAVVCMTISGPTASLALGIIGAVLFVVGLGTVGMMVLRETDADWEHTPEYRGLRPAAGASS